MLEPIKIGYYLMNLRKELNLTQNQLAEKLHISHQAVSRWESGNAIPDTEMLLMLATIYGVTVDEILRASASDEEDEVFEEEPQVEIPEEEEVPSIEVIPQPPEPPKHEHHHEHRHEHHQNREAWDGEERPKDKKGITMQRIRRLAPFTDHETLDVLVRKFVTDNTYTIDEISGLAPFLSRETMEFLLSSLSDDEGNVQDMHTLRRLAPFIGTQAMDRLVAKFEQEMDFDGITALAPFISRETINALLRNITD